LVELACLSSIAIAFAITLGAFSGLAWFPYLYILNDAYFFSPGLSLSNPCQLPFNPLSSDKSKTNPTAWLNIRAFMASHCIFPKIQIR